MLHERSEQRIPPSFPGHFTSTATHARGRHYVDDSDGLIGGRWMQALIVTPPAAFPAALDVDICHLLWTLRPVHRLRPLYEISYFLWSGRLAK